MQHCSLVRNLPSLFIMKLKTVRRVPVQQSRALQEYMTLSIWASAEGHFHFLQMDPQDKELTYPLLPQ